MIVRTIVNTTYTWVISNPSPGVVAGPIIHEYCQWVGGNTSMVLVSDPGAVFCANLLVSRRICGQKYRVDTTTLLSPGDFLWLDIVDAQGNISEVQVRIELTDGLDVKEYVPEPIDRDDSLLDALDAYWEHARCE